MKRSGAQMKAAFGPLVHDQTCKPKPGATCTLQGFFSGEVIAADRSAAQIQLSHPHQCLSALSSNPMPHQVLPR